MWQIELLAGNLTLPAAKNLVQACAGTMAAFTKGVAVRVRRGGHKGPPGLNLAPRRPLGPHVLCLPVTGLHPVIPPRIGGCCLNATSPRKSPRLAHPTIMVAVSLALHPACLASPLSAANCWVCPSPFPHSNSKSRPPSASGAVCFNKCRDKKKSRWSQQSIFLSLGERGI